MKQARSLLLMFLIAVGAAFLIMLLIGEQPSTLIQAFRYTFFTRFGLGYSFYYTTPLLFTGLAVAVCFHAGLFNIGSEGQLLWGSIAVVCLSHFFPELPRGLALISGILAAGLAGSLWAFIPAYLKSYRGIHEVITTLLLNLIATAWVNYLILYTFKNPDSQAAETELISTGYRLPQTLFATTPANSSFFLAVLITVFLHWALFKTTFGFEVRALGENARTAEFSGIPRSKRLLQAFLLSGFLSGLVGVNEVMGGEYKVIEGFSPGYGFTGIAVALLARNQPLVILFTSFLLGSLQNFSRELEFFGDVISKEVAWVLQALLIFVVGTRKWWEQKWK